MYDPCTVAHEIRYPWAKHITTLKDGSVHKYHEPIVTIWHVDPEAPGRGNRKDDSCGWFRPPMTEGERVRIREIGEREWGDIFGKRRAIQEGASYASVCYEPSTYDAIYWAWRRIKHEEQKRVIWKYGTRPTRGELHEIYELASNPVDNLRVSVREVNSAEACGAFFLTVYRCYQRYHRPWWRHPRWHVHHWRLQVHPWQKFKRWAFERCADCGKGFTWGYSPWGHINDDRRYHTECRPQAHSPLTAQLEEDRG